MHPHDDNDDDADLAVVHRQVSAAAAPRPATTAPNSVFALGASVPPAVPEQARPTVKRARRIYAAHDFIDAVAKVGPMSINQMSLHLGISRSVATRWMTRLAKAGQLRESGSHGKATLWGAPAAATGWVPGAAPTRDKATEAALPAPAPKPARAVVPAAAEGDGLTCVLLNNGVLLIEQEAAPAVRLSRQQTRTLWLYLKQLDSVLQA